MKKGEDTDGDFNLCINNNIWFDYWKFPQCVDSSNSRKRGLCDGTLSLYEVWLSISLV
jgi:hypothetical protein